MEFGLATKEEKQILALCQLLVRFCEILDEESQFLSASAKVELLDLAQKFVGLYTALATRAKEQGVKRWKLNPTLHLFQHLCEWRATTDCNPRFHWSYSDEDLAGMMADVASSCHGQTMMWRPEPSSSGCILLSVLEWV